MMLLISPDDFQRLSVGTQQEILSLLVTRPTAEPPASDEPPDFWNTDEPMPYGEPMSALSPSVDEMLEEKKIVDLTVEQARALVANVSERSLETLRRFALGEPIALDEIMGENCAYKDRIDLKRSFVGAVNRRLRTVTGNRLDVLFGADRDGKRIRIRPLTITALRQALNIQEPLPNFEYYDLSGQPLVQTNAAVHAVQAKLQAAWQDFSGYPSSGLAKLEPVVVIAHLIKHDFRMVVGAQAGFDDEWGSIKKFRFITAKTEHTPLLTQMRPDGTIELNDEVGGGMGEVFLTIGENCGVLIRVAWFGHG